VVKKISTQSKSCFIIIPVYNDHGSCLLLLEQICKLNLKIRFKIIIVDDASNLFDLNYNNLNKFKPVGNIESIKILKLQVNSGVNGSIYHGLSHASSQAKSHDFFIIMDADGEDAPEDIRKLFDGYEKGSITVAKRQGFSRSVIFYLWRSIFLTVMKLATRNMVNFGNFSLLDFEACQKLLYSRNINVSYVGAVLTCGVQIIKIPLKRSKRYLGKSVSGRLGQIQHGFRIMSCFTDVILIRIIQLCFGFLIINLIGVLFIVYLKLVTAATIPGWASLILVILSSSSVQLIFTLVMLILVYLHIQRLFLAVNEN